MNGQDYKNFFVHPAEAAHFRYEALRCVFVEKQPMKEIAQRYGVGDGTIRNRAGKFRRRQDAGEPPPFSLRQCMGGLQPTNFP